MWHHALWITAVLLHLHGATASLPETLSNFQNEYTCNTAVKLVRPETVEDIQKAVEVHDAVVPLGEGHSWNKPFFCASYEESGESTPGSRLSQKEKEKNNSSKSKTGARAANIVMTTIRPLKIEVDEKTSSVWVDAGVKVWDLLRYLANYVTKEAPAGYTLPAPPWFVAQTIGGALATGTHGSNLKHGSLSNQVLAFQVVLANGTLTEISAESDPFLMRAMRVNVGKLGIVTAAKMEIVKEVPVKRTLRRGLSPVNFLFMLKEAQEMYRKNRSLPEWMVESQVFWLVQLHEFAIYSFQRGDDEDTATQQEILKEFEPEETTRHESLYKMLEVEGDPKVPADKKMVLVDDVFKTASEFLEEYNATTIQKAMKLDRTEAGGDIADGVSWKEPIQLAPNVIYGNQFAGAPLLATNYIALTALLGNASIESHLSYISMPERLIPSLIRGTPFDQYELAIPIDQVADCMEGAFKVLYGEDIAGKDAKKRKMDKGFRTAPLIRFVGKEDGFLSPTNDIPRMYINLEDYIFYNRGRKRNELFYKLMAYLRGNPACGNPRLHWGKAGWPESGCWHGADEYKQTWCDFGCAVRALDPLNKFKDSATDRWNWEGAGLDICCTSTGYDTSIEGCTCKVRRIRPVDDCPPAPYYVDR